MTINISTRLFLLSMLVYAVSESVHLARVAGALPVTMHTIHEVRPRVYDAKATYAQISGTGPVVRLANKTLKLAVMQRIQEFRKEIAPDLHQRPSMPDQLLTEISPPQATRL